MWITTLEAAVWIGVVGSGRICGNLGRLLTNAGHEVLSSFSSVGVQA
jgi:hypothetical protein